MPYIRTLLRESVWNFILTMGTTETKEAKNSGDPQVQILNQLNSHEERHAEHEVKLNIIIVIVMLQLLITIYRIYKKNARVQALKAAKSVADISRIWSASSVSGTIHTRVREQKHKRL